MVQRGLLLEHPKHKISKDKERSKLQLDTFGSTYPETGSVAPIVNFGLRLLLVLLFIINL